MDNGKMFDYPPKCPGLLTSKLTSIFGWRHTYRVHHRQKGLNHFYNNNNNNLHKTYSLNLLPKKNHETTSSNPSLPEASSSSSSKTVNDLKIAQLSVIISVMYSNACLNRFEMETAK